MNSAQRIKRHIKIRSRMKGTSDRPRVCVYRSNTGMEVQIIDDVAGKTIVGMHEKKQSSQSKTQLAQTLGATLAKEARAKGITNVVFDRGGYAYHGRVKALAEALREGGLLF